ncbi:UNVERIFIED_CONTAM: hypothetical protein FKN15_023526 [Acipenser sinensis]
MNPVLSLSQNNRISWIPSGAFSQQLHLRELYLQNNQLSDRGLQNDTFSKLRSLEYLNTASCPLLSSGACPSGKYSFLSTPQLRGVSLRYNRLTALAVSQAAFSTLRHLQVLDTTGNPEPISIQLHGTGEPATPTDIIPTPTETSQGTRGLPGQQETSQHADTNETVQ